MFADLLGFSAASRSPRLSDYLSMQKMFLSNDPHYDFDNIATQGVLAESKLLLCSALVDLGFGVGRGTNYFLLAIHISSHVQAQIFKEEGGGVVFKKPKKFGGVSGLSTNSINFLSDFRKPGGGNSPPFTAPTNIIDI